MSNVSPKLPSLPAFGARFLPRARRSPATGRRRRKRTELSEMITQRARETAALLASIRVHKAEVAAALRERFQPALRAGETVPDYELTLELAGRSVELSFARLEELDDRHHRAKGRRAGLARELDRIATEELYPMAVAVRQQIDGAFGRRAGTAIHTFSGKTPRVAIRLKEHVKRMVYRLEDPNLLPPRKHFVGVDGANGTDELAACWKRWLEGPLRGLTEADEELGRFKVELVMLSDQRQRAKQRFDAVYGESLRLVEVVFLMAGLSTKMIKSLRSYRERRRLIRWAREKRQARARHDAEAPPAEASPAEKRRRRSPGAFATVSRWLKKLRVVA